MLQVKFDTLSMRQLPTFGSC